MKDKSLIGKTVVCYEPYHRNILDTAKEDTITKVGNKFIHVGKMKFDLDTMSSDLPHYRLYVGTMDEFTEAVNLQKNISSLLYDCQRRVNMDLPLPLLREVEKRFIQIKNLLNEENGQ